MMLVDNDAWALFDLPTKERYRQETLRVFRKYEGLAEGTVFGIEYPAGTT